MSEIPADIMRAAADALLAAGHMVKIGDESHRAIARAILAERDAEHERCNKIIRAAWDSGLSLEAFKAALTAHHTTEQGD